VLPGILSLMRPGILSLILDRHPLPPPLLLLLLPLSLPPPGCHPPFAILRRLDMVFCIFCLAASQLCRIPLEFVLYCRIPAYPMFYTVSVKHHYISQSTCSRENMTCQSIKSHAIHQWGYL
jgi:hypothetical protein